MDWSNYQLQLFLETFTSPTGLVVAFAFLATMVAAMFFRNLKWWLIPLPLWTCTFAMASSDLVNVNTTLAFPMEYLRPYGRPLTGGLLLLLVMPVVLSTRGWRARLMLPATVLMFVFQMIVSARLATGGLVDRAIFGAATLTANFVIFGIGLSRWLQDWADVRRILWCVAAAAMLLVLGTLYQLVVNRHAIVINTRLYCTTANPQHAAMIMAASLPVICYLLVRGGISRLWRFVLGATAGFLVIFLIWTGSRTGFIMSLVGVGLFFRAKLGRMVAAILIVGVFALLAWQMFGESVQSAERLFSTEDTRSGVWKSLTNEFSENVLVGTVHENITTRENSYLSTAAMTGLLGLVPLLTAMGFAAAALFKLYRVRRCLGEHAMLADLVIAGLVSLGVGAFAEGFLLGVLTHQIFMIYIYLALAAFLLEAAEQAQPEAAPEYAEVPEMIVTEPVY